MLSLSKITGYGIQALSCLEIEIGHSREIADITKCSEVPPSYLPKIINSLSRRGLVITRRGYHGGVSLARDPAEISLLEIVEAVEGEAWLGQCLLGMEECEIHASCVTHAFWSRIRGEITEELRKTSLQSLIGYRESYAPNRSADPLTGEKQIHVVQPDAREMNAESI